MLEDQGIDLNAHLYVFRDVDSFHWGSEAAGFDEDNNRRELTAYGLRLTPKFRVTESTGLLLGFDGELSQLRNSRHRTSVSGEPVGQRAPYDQNEDNLLTAGYAELTQSFFADRLTGRAGVRYTRNKLSQQDTPNVNLTGETDRTFDGTTYSVGLAYAVPARPQGPGKLCHGLPLAHKQRVGGRVHNGAVPGTHYPRQRRPRCGAE